jgi:hypothetical protein
MNLHHRFESWAWGYLAMGAEMKKRDKKLITTAQLPFPMPGWVA